MTKIFVRFLRNRRGTIALIFAGALLPLVMLIGLSIDYSFYVQARSQFALAADAAATYAIREATAAYALNGYDSNSAANTGITAGNAWFTAQLATLPTATNKNASPTNVTPNQLLSSTNPAGFTATVTYTGQYPPFFNPLFHKTSYWTITGASQANSQYSYVEVLVLLDTGGAMLISADQAAALTLEDNTVCFNKSMIPSKVGFDGVGDYIDPDNTVNWTNVQNIKAGTSGTSVKCNNGYTGPYTPCAFACHTTPTPTSDGYTGDFYGEARRLHVQLKTDIVFQAIETIITSMKNSNQVQGQFTIGAYQFNDDACPIITGNTASGDALPEATGNLSGALTTIDNDDYTQNKFETAFPPLVNSTETDDFTDFPQSVRDLISGKFKCLSTTIPNALPTVKTGTALPSFPPAFSDVTAGTTPGMHADFPEKNIFIITDGLSDTSPNSTCGRYMGEITGATAESNGVIQNICASANGAASTATCLSLKKLGFTVYVLDVSYPKVVVHTYYENNDKGSGNTSNTYIAQDFPTLTTSAGAGTPNIWNTVQPGASLTPLQQGMQACASSGDFYQASSSSEIQTAMTQMLKSALDSAVRIQQ